jgi:O-antigen/teichoic acid export membrane protein
MEKMEKDSSYSHILKYTGIFGSVQGLNILVGIIRNKLVAMILGPNGMGLVALFNSTIKLLSDSTNFGIGMSGVKSISEKYDKGDSEGLKKSISLIRSWSLLTAFFGMFLCILLSPLLNQWTFNWGNHTLHFILLSPVVALMAITVGESAILKATRKLKSLAKISVYNVFGALLTSVPIYYFFGESGIVPSLVVIALIQMILTISYSYRQYPLRLSFKKQFLDGGFSMLRLGIAFVFAGIMGSGAEFIIKSFLNNTGSLDVVGLFNAGYMMTMTYAGMVFSAMETDYFPRLSAIQGTGMMLNDCVNKQIEVCLLLVSPLLVAFMIGLPILLPLLYSGKFLPVMGMVQVTIFAMYMRAITLPISYISLGKGDSMSYLMMEASYDIVIVLLVLFGYRQWGLTGTGIGITICSVFNFIILLIYMRWRFDYRISKPVLRFALMQIPFGCMAYGLTYVHNPLIYWSLGILVTLGSLWYSIKILKSKTHLWESLKRRMSR